MFHKPLIRSAKKYVETNINIQRSHLRLINIERNYYLFSKFHGVAGSLNICETMFDLQNAPRIARMHSTKSNNYKPGQWQKNKHNKRISSQLTNAEFLESAKQRERFSRVLQEFISAESPQAKNAILNPDILEIPNTNLDQLMKFLYGLDSARKSTKGEYFPINREFRQKTCEVILSHLPRMHPSMFLEVLIVYAKNFSELPSNVGRRFERYLLDDSRMSKFCYHDVTMILMNLDHLRHKPSEEFVKAFVDITIEKFPTIDPFGATFALKALAFCEASPSKELIMGLEQRAEEKISSMKPPLLSSLLRSFVQLKYKPDDDVLLQIDTVLAQDIANLKFHPFRTAWMSLHALEHQFSPELLKAAEKYLIREIRHAHPGMISWIAEVLAGSPNLATQPVLETFMGTLFHPKNITAYPVDALSSSINSLASLGAASSRDMLMRVEQAVLNLPPSKEKETFYTKSFQTLLIRAHVPPSEEYLKYLDENMQYFDPEIALQSLFLLGVFGIKPTPTMVTIASESLLNLPPPISTKFSVYLAVLHVLGPDSPHFLELADKWLLSEDDDFRIKNMADSNRPNLVHLLRKIPNEHRSRFLDPAEHAIVTSIISQSTPIRVINMIRTLDGFRNLDRPPPNVLLQALFESRDLNLAYRARELTQVLSTGYLQGADLELYKMVTFRAIMACDPKIIVEIFNKPNPTSVKPWHDNSASFESDGAFEMLKLLAEKKDSEEWLKFEHKDVLLELLDIFLEEHKLVCTDKIEQCSLLFEQLGYDSSTSNAYLARDN